MEQLPKRDPKTQIFLLGNLTEVGPPWAYVIVDKDTVTNQKDTYPEAREIALQVGVEELGWGTRESLVLLQVTHVFI
jgi:hypothetical protein